MEEIRFHGRGGQGTVVASVLMAKAFFKIGYDILSFPSFGVERRGAPVEAYLRIDKKKIWVRSNVYEPDHIVVQDAKLINIIDITKGLKKGGWVLINASNPTDLFDKFKGFRVAIINASEIAYKHQLGTRTHPMINTAMVGAFAKILGTPPLAEVTAAIQEEIKIKPDKNIQAAKEAYERVVDHGIV